jgi:hypothetical protein
MRETPSLEHRSMAPDPLRFIIATQCVSILMTVVVYTVGFSAGIEESRVLAIGGNMTMALFVLIIVNHYNAGKGKVVPALLALPGIIGPVYALMPGPLRHVISYHGAVVVLHLLVLWRLAKVREREASSSPPPEEEDVS